VGDRFMTLWGCFWAPSFGIDLQVGLVFLHISSEELCQSCSHTTLILGITKLVEFPRVIHGYVDDTKCCMG
jgi:hypothetical protein